MAATAHKIALGFVLLSLAILLVCPLCRAEDKSAYFIGNSFTRVAAPDGVAGLAAGQANNLTVGVQMQYFNGKNPLPPEIQSLLEQR